ncbi:hypothetical protein SI65_09903 [Aspergillus cristatus]|uniref:ASST-domain-containing protein n=1 Tax=Aspergillus cristatus TaxID=573508 RepID=A0A1E3B1C2_ASPCR|nr:hypothetical protein SI65_09903 [Aspergillus cristatus]
MSRWYRILPCLRRPQHRRAKGAWPDVFPKAWLLTLCTIVSLLYLFCHFVLPHLLKFRLRTDLSWYDLGLYGFGPTRSYASFEYESPVVEITQWDSGCDPRYIFLAPRGDSIPHPGPTILDAAGNLVWMKYNHDITQDFKLQRYQGEDYLTYWEGEEVAGGLGQGSWFMLDSTYTQRYEIHPIGNFDGGDLHEFILTDDGTALITIYEPIPADLTAIGGPALGWLYDGLFQEIDVETKELLFEWRASNHFPVNVTYEALHTKGYEKDTAFDYYHINSVDKDAQGNYLISARHAHSVSYIDGSTGAVLWMLGGKANDFTDLSDGTATDFRWQHDARWRDNTTLTLFDNTAHSNEDPEASSRGMRIHLDFESRTAELQVAYHHPQVFKSTSQGNMQVLEDTGNVFIGWGHSAAYTEFTPDGSVVCDVHFGASLYYTFGRVVSYRAFKDSWIGRPLTNPDAVVDDNVVYVSWNGATEVAAWQLEVWDGHDLDNVTFNAALQVDKDGFETEIEIPDDLDSRILRVAALDAHGNRLPNGWKRAAARAIPVFLLSLVATAVE